ncbi:hypothetical protein [Burkholderia multivorans]|uniref:hypothetical protein n=1 Tax=Burkholderia multivorans TaxID=87883 RepID=UPI0021C148DE|nr:hypothetical protein [Burkholderia multivorans]
MVFSSKDRTKRRTAFLSDLQDIGKMCHFVEIVARVTGLSSNAVILRVPRTSAVRGGDAGRSAGSPRSTTARAGTAHGARPARSAEPDVPRPFGVPPTEK